RGAADGAGRTRHRLGDAANSWGRRTSRRLSSGARAIGHQGVIIYGINPVIEALRAGRVLDLRVGDRNNERMRKLTTLAEAQGVRIRRVPLEQLDRESRHGVHQGVVADVEEAQSYSVEELVREADGPALIVVLDGVEDPHN